MRYSLDTSALVEAWRRSYPPDIFPGLWDALDGLVRSGELQATEEVLHELERKDDDVYRWVRDRQDVMIVEIDREIQVEVTRILATHKKLVDTRKSRSGADPFVIALAQIHRCAVVTNERPTQTPTRPNIPDVCADLGVRVLDILQLIRECGWVFGV